MYKQFFSVPLLSAATLFAASAETLIDSSFRKDAANWHAMKDSGTVRHDPAASTLVVTADDSGMARIANWKRITADMCAGKTIRLTASARGKGELTAVFVMTVKSVSGGVSYPRFAGKPVVLGDDFAVVEYSLDLSSHSPVSVEPRFELKGGNAEAHLRSVKCEVFGEEGVTLSAEYSYIPFRSGSSAGKVRLSASPGAAIQILHDGRTEHVTADASGIAEADLPGTRSEGLAQYTAAVRGKAVRVFTEAVADDEFAALKAAADGCKLRRPSSVLILGDSLSDYDRGRNYADQMAFYLNNGRREKIAVYNFGIGGDDVKRVSRRIVHHFDPRAPGEYFQKRYQDLSKVQYDHIIVFLGQNDTKASYTSGYETTFVPADKWEEHYRTLLAELKKHFPKAKIFLCSPIHVDTARQDALAETILKSKDNVWKFGIVKHMERYADTVRRVAAEAGASCIDLYTPSKDHPERSKLFRSDDGLHLSPAGERFVALQIMRYL